MASEWIGLAGVGVGASITFLGQLIVSRQETKRDVARWRREKRAEVYTRAISQYQAFNDMRRHPEIPFATKFAQMELVNATLNELHLWGTRAVRDRASKTGYAMFEIMRDESPSANQALTQAIAQLTQAIREELGIKG